MKKIELLTRLIGDIPDNNNPLGTRLNSIEENMKEIAAQFRWSAYTNKATDALVIKYSKLVSADPQIDSIELIVEPVLKKLIDNEVAEVTLTELILNDGEVANFEKDELVENKRVGEFTIPLVGKSLRGLLKFIKPADGQQPFAALKIKVIPSIKDGVLPPQNWQIIPIYDWKKREN